MHQHESSNIGSNLVVSLIIMALLSIIILAAPSFLLTALFAFVVSIANPDRSIYATIGVAVLQFVAQLMLNFILPEEFPWLLNIPACLLSVLVSICAIQAMNTIDREEENKRQQEVRDQKLRSQYQINQALDALNATYRVNEKLKEQQRSKESTKKPEEQPLEPGATYIQDPVTGKWVKIG